MTRVVFTVPAIPVAQPRQRHRAFVAGGHVRTQNFTPARHPVQAFKATVRLAASQAHIGAPLEGPLALVATFVFPRPGRLCWKKRPMPRCWHHSKPDTENVLKALQDALTGLLWKDDAQIAEVRCSKVYAAGDEQPAVSVRVEQLPELDKPVRADEVRVEDAAGGTAGPV